MRFDARLTALEKKRPAADVPEMRIFWREDGDRAPVPIPGKVLVLRWPHEYNDCPPLVEREV